MLRRLHARMPELVADTSYEEWNAAELHLTAGLSLLQYHRECAEPNPLGVRLNRLCQMRDGVMARNLLEIRRLEAGRGPTFVHAHNAHLQQPTASMIKMLNALVVMDALDSGELTWETPVRVSREGGLRFTVKSCPSGTSLPASSRILIGAAPTHSRPTEPSLVNCSCG